VYSSFSFSDQAAAVGLAAAAAETLETAAAVLVVMVRL
jgi:hypothetical protein